MILCFSATGDCKYVATRLAQSAEIDAITCNVEGRRTNRYMSPRTPAFITEWIAEPLYDKKVRCAPPPLALPLGELSAQVTERLTIRSQVRNARKGKKKVDGRKSV